MTLANVITLVRLGLIPLILALLLSGREVWAFSLLLAFLIGDLVDGALARARGEVTPLGEFLDPLADKLLAAGLLAAFAALGRLPWLGFALLGGLQLVFLLGTAFLARHRRRIIKARPLGKAAATAISLGLVWAFFPFPGSRELIYLGIFLSYLAGLDYLRLALGVAPARARGRTPPEGGQ